MAKYYLTLGYPLMVSASTLVEGYYVEISDNETQNIPNDIALLWAELLSCGFSDNNLAIGKLAGRGLLLAGDSKKELLAQCYQFRPVRQGIGSTLMENNEKERNVLFFSIRLGDRNYTLSDFQRLFWNAANGKDTIEKIIKSIQAECISISEEDKANQIFALIKHGLLFIKK